MSRFRAVVLGAALVAIAGCAPDRKDCLAGSVACGDSCVRLATDGANCGGCGSVCGPGAVCSNGACAATCASPLATCEADGAAYCADTRSDPANCGACGAACPVGQLCSSGTCGPTCVAPLATCGAGAAAFCTNLAHDPANCGSCAHACNEGEVCDGGTCATACEAAGSVLCGGACVDLDTDVANCGSCGAACPAGTTCAGGDCVPTCPAGQVRCGARCADLATDQANCGACGHTCPGFGVCAGGACTAVSCRGEIGFPGAPDLVGPRTFTVAPLDVDRDGQLDLVVAPAPTAFGTQNGTVEVLRNLGARRFASPVSYPTGIPVDLVRVGDVNGDGLADVVAGGGGNVTVLRGTAAGGLAPPPSPQALTSGMSSNLVVADLDGDGRADAISADYAISVRFGGPSGAFGPSTSYWSNEPMFFPRSVAVGDMNGDGLLDVVGADPQGFELGVFMNAGGGALAAVIPYAIQNSVLELALADVDGDMDLDVLGVANYPLYGLVVLRNAGDGTLAAPAFYENGYGSYSLAVADLDGDGRPDAALGNWGDLRRVDVFRNAGDGTFLAPEPYYDQGAWEIAADDLDGDGRSDLAVASSPGLGVHLLWNAGATLLQAGFSPAPLTPEDLALGDVDGDGLLDVVAVEHAPGTLAVLHGRGDGTFAPEQVLDVPNASRLSARDLDGDGDADVVCATSSWTTGAVALQVYRSDEGALVQVQQLEEVSSALASADLDRDGAQDLVAHVQENQTWYVAWLRGQGDGTFEAPAVLGPSVPCVLWRAAAGDLDGNGWPDVIGIELFGPVHVWLNLGGGSFVHSTVQTTSGWRDLALGDLDGDGDLDVAFARDGLDGHVALLLGAGDGTFMSTPPLPYYGASNVEIGAPAGRTQNVVFVRGSLAEEVGVLAVGPDGALSLTGRWTTRGGMIGSDMPLVMGDVDGDLRPDMVAGAIDGIAVRRAACLP